MLTALIDEPDGYLRMENAKLKSENQRLKKVFELLKNILTEYVVCTKNYLRIVYLQRKANPPPIDVQLKLIIEALDQMKKTHNVAVDVLKEVSKDD